MNRVRHTCSLPFTGCARSTGCTRTSRRDHRVATFFDVATFFEPGRIQNCAGSRTLKGNRGLDSNLTGDPAVLLPAEGRPFNSATDIAASQASGRDQFAPGSESVRGGRASSTRWFVKAS